MISGLSAKPILDLCSELDFLFLFTVSRPLRPLRKVIERRGADISNRNQALSLLQKFIDRPLRTLLRAGDIILTSLLQHIDDVVQHARLRAALLRLLMYISDCHRYLYNNARARDAAELMRLVAPRDPEAHMRLALTGAQIPQSSMFLAHFFHFCAFLANRDVGLDHSEAVVAKNFVLSCRTVSSRTNSDAGENADCDTTALFATHFVDAVWSILTDPFDTAKEKVLDETLWSALRAALGNGLGERDCQYIVAAVMFALHRTRPQAQPTLRLRPERELADEMVCRTILAISSCVQKGLNDMIATVRRRRKNRRRSEQKKRRADGRAVTAPDGTIVAADILRVAVDFDEHTPALGALSFLTSYWAVHRAAPRPWSDLGTIAQTLTSLRSNVDSLSTLAQLTMTESLVNHVASKLLAATGPAVFPALAEDVAFCHFAPCIDHDVLCHVVLHEVPLPSIVTPRAVDGGDDSGGNGGACKSGMRSGDEVDGVLRTCLNNLEQKTFEKVVSMTTNRHLEAFSLQCAKETADWTSGIERQSLCKVVSMTVRKMRFMRLIWDLERLYGGTLLHHARVTQKAAPAQAPAQVSAAPAQAPAPVSAATAGNDARNPAEKANETGDDNIDKTIPNTNVRQVLQNLSGDGNSIHEQIEGSELERRVCKRRRLQGVFTLGSTHGTEASAPRTNSNGSRDTSGQHRQSVPPQDENPVSWDMSGQLMPSSPRNGNIVPQNTSGQHRLSVSPREENLAPPEQCSPVVTQPQSTHPPLPHYPQQSHFVQSSPPPPQGPGESQGQEPAYESLSCLLTRLLYNPKTTLSPPQNAKSSAFWREPPSDDYPRRVY